MTKLEAINYYGGNVSALARALGIDQSTVYSWGKYPPDTRQLQLERITGGALAAEPQCKARVLGLTVDEAAKPAAFNDPRQLPTRRVGPQRRSSPERRSGNDRRNMPRDGKPS